MKPFRKKEPETTYEIAPEHILEVKDLHVRIAVDDYDLHAVRGVNFSLKKGETLGLVGESGCGKSVTSKEILGINPDNCRSEGQILYRTKSGKVLNLLELDRDGTVYRAIRGAEISMIFQEPMTAFSPLYTIGNQLAEIILLHDPKATKASARQRVLEMLKKVGIANSEKRIDQYPHEFSGGQRQRIVIARALILNPEFIVADEPISALDISIQAQIIELLNNIKKKYNLTYAFISHDLRTVRNFCDRVAVMYLGEIVEIASAKELFENPKHPYTQALIQSIPQINISGGKTFPTMQGEPQTNEEPPKGCNFSRRCPFVKDCCKTSAPTITNISDSHYVKCFLYN